MLKNIVLTTTSGACKVCVNVLSSMQYVQLHCFSRPKSARQSRLAPARPFAHAHIPLSPLTHTFSHAQLQTQTDKQISIETDRQTERKLYSYVHTAGLNAQFRFIAQIRFFVWLFILHF